MTKGRSRTERLRWVHPEADDRVAPDCRRCHDYISNPGMVHAAASVGIEHGKSTDEMLMIAAEQYHASNHREGS